MQMASPVFSSVFHILDKYDGLVPGLRLWAGMRVAVVATLVIIGICIVGFFVFLTVLLVRALLKYLNSKDVRKEKDEMKKSLGQSLKEHRVRCKMTQEFVSESLGVSRQAVSKWESGISDPSISNLLAVSKYLIFHRRNY